MPQLVGPDGAIVNVPDEEAGQLQAGGYRPIGLGEASRIGAASQPETSPGLLSGVGAGASSLLSGVTLGLSDVALKPLLDRGAFERMAADRAAHPFVSGAGNLAGALAPALATGGASAGAEAGIGARILAASPAGLAGKLGGAVSGLGEGAGFAGRLAAATAGAGTEGALYGGGQYLTETALEDKPLSAEGFVAGMGHGALFAAPIGGGLTLASKTLQRARALFPRSEISAASASGVQQQAASSIAQATRDGDQMVAAAERKLSDVEAQTQTALAGENTTRRVFGEAHPQAMVDQVTGAVDRQQITQALDGYQQARAQLDDWLASESDPELAKALTGMRAPEPGEIGGRIGPAVPTGEFGAPGAGGFKSQDELAQLAMGTDVPGVAPSLEPQATRQLRSGAKGTPVGEAPALSAPAGFEPPRVDPNSEGFTQLRGNGEFHAMGDDEFEAYQKAYKQRLTPDERAEAQSYAGGGRFRELNGAARQGVVHAANAESASKLDELIAKSPLEHPIQVARVVGMENGGGEARKLWEGLHPGDVVTDGGWQSTTTNFEYAHSLGDVMMIADVPKGYPAAPLPGPHNEWEMVLRRDTSYRVKSIREVDGKLYAHVEVVPSEAPPSPLKVISRGESAPEGPAVRVTKAGSAGSAPADDLPLNGVTQPTATEAPARTPRPISDEEYAALRDAYGSRLSPDEAKALDVYTSSTYKDINRALRHGEIRNGRERFVTKLDDAIAKSSLHDNAVLYRGLSGDEAKQFRNLGVGDMFEEKAFVSTSSSPTAFKRDVNLHIDVPAGYEAAPVPSSIDEKEWLLRRDTRFVVTGIEDSGATRNIRVRVEPSSPPRPVSEMVSSKTGRQPDAPPIEIIKSPAAPHMDRGGDLMAALQDTKSKLGEGGKFSEIGSAPREAYATDKAARSAEAARHFRAQALEARDAAQPWNAGIPHGKGGSYETSPMAAAEREAQAGAVKQQMTGVVEPGAVPRFDPETKSYFEGPPGAPAHTGGPEDLAKMLGVDLQGMPVSAAGYSARREAMGMPGALERGARKTPEERAIAKAIMRHNGKNVDIGPNLAQGAKIIGDMEEASARLTDVLGAEAPATAVENAAQYRAAIKAQAEASAASAAKAGADVRTRVGPAMDATAVDDDIAKALQRHEMRQSARGADATAVDSDVTKALRAHDMRNPTAAPAAESAGLGSGLADVGSALEVLHAIGAHVPAVSHIPVIGPILGLWLKARAVWGILGRKGGSIGRSTEGSIAAKAAATRERIVAATGAILEGAGKVAGAASHLAGPAVLLAGPLFAGGGKPDSDKPRDLFEARVNDIVRAQSPGAIDQAISQRFPTSDPALHDAIVAQLQRGIGFLDSKRPKQTVLPGVLPGDGTWKPSMAAIDEFAKFVHAVNDPVSVLEDLAKGHPSAEGAETLRVVYPELYAYAQKELLKAAPQMATTLPYSRRVMISILYKIPVDGTMQPSHAQYLQVPAPPAPGPAHSPSATGPLRLGQQTMSPLDARASGA